MRFCARRDYLLKLRVMSCARQDLLLIARAEMSRASRLTLFAPVEIFTFTAKADDRVRVMRRIAFLPNPLSICAT